MKIMIQKTLLTALAISASSLVMAQISTPQPSPQAKITQTVGIDKITVEYSRPGMKDRAIFGELLPYGKLWRTGANAATKITFPNDVVVAGKELKAKTYSIFTIPGEDKWTVIFNNDENASTGKYDESKDAARIEVTPISLNDAVETFTIDFSNLTNDGGLLTISWEKTRVAVPIVTKTKEQVAKQIEKVMAGPTARDYYAAADYYLSIGENMEKAKEYIDIAVKEYNTFWAIRRQALIYAANGQHKEAIKLAEKSKEMATEAGNDAYVKMNEASIKEWKKK